MTRIRFAHLCLAAALCALALAPAAQASTASAEGTTITVAGGDESSDISFPGGGEYFVDDLAGITAGAGCEQRTATRVSCGFPSAFTLRSVVANLGAGDDRYVLVGFYAQTVNGGPGNDTLYAGADVDTVHGDAGDDYVEGGPGADDVYGDDGNDEVRGHNDGDRVYGGPGLDSLHGDGGDGGLDDDGSDQIFSRDGEQDQVTCGFGGDIVESDDIDVVDSTGCETNNAAPTGDPDPPSDDRAPSLAASAKKRLSIAKATKKPGYGVGVVVDEDCDLFASLTISKANAKKFGLGRKKLTLDTLRAPVTADSYAIGLWATGKNKRKLKALAAERGTVRVPALITVRATDANGNWRQRKLDVKLTG